MERGRTNHLRLMGAEQHVLFAEAATETSGFAFVVRSMKLDFLKASADGRCARRRDLAGRGEEVLVTAEVRVAFISEGRAQPIPKSIRVSMKADLDE